MSLLILTRLDVERSIRVVITVPFVALSSKYRLATVTSAPSCLWAAAQLERLGRGMIKFVQVSRALADRLLKSRRQRYNLNSVLGRSYSSKLRVVEFWVLE